MDDNDVLEEFRIEAEELLNESEEILLKIESTSDYTADFNNLFRSFHSLKGAAGMFEIDELQGFMHTLEDQFESIRNQSSMTQFQVDYFLTGVDCARKILAGEAYSFDSSTFKQGKNAQATQAADTLRAKAKKDQDSNPKKGLIYIVDDEEFICETLADILNNHNYEVKTFSDPSLVLPEVSKASPDLICTDLKMPDINGLELLKLIREKKYDFPIVFISGFIDNDLLTEGLTRGASGFLEKPFEEHQIIGLVSNAIDKYKAWKLLNKSINYILYQFNDLDKYLEIQGKNTLRQGLRTELQELLKLKKSLFKN